MSLLSVIDLSLFLIIHNVMFIVLLKHHISRSKKIKLCNHKEKKIKILVGDNEGKKTILI